MVGVCSGVWRFWLGLLKDAVFVILRSRCFRFRLVGLIVVLWVVFVVAFACLCCAIVVMIVCFWGLFVLFGC